MTELWSLGTGIGVVPLGLSWAVILALAGVLAWRCRGARSPAVALPPPGAAARPGPVELALAGAITLVLAGALLTALAAAPNNWDSMTYHLPRVRHWMQQGSIAHYPTHNLRQLYLGPFAEWVVLHLYVLAGDDRPVALVQWLSVVGLTLGVSLIAAELGCGRRGQLLAALFAVSLPMVVLQASSTQSDAVTALWTVCTVLFLLRHRRSRSPADAVAAGAALGLLVLTKPTGLICSAPFVAWLGVARLRRGGRGWLLLALLIASVMALNAGHWTRNARLFGNPVGPAERRLYVNADLGAASAVSNAVRNAAVHLASPWPAWNRAIERATAAAHYGLGLPLDPPGAAFHDQPFALSARWRHEGRAGAPLHLGLIGLATATLLAARGRHGRRGHPRGGAPSPLAAPGPSRHRPPGPGWRRGQGVAGRDVAGKKPAAGDDGGGGSDRVLVYGACCVVAFLLFSGILRWQPDNVRLLLPLTVLWAPAVGAAADRGRAVRRALPLLAVALCGAALPPLFTNELRPLVGPASVLTTPRDDQYFAGRRQEERHLRQLIARVRDGGCRRVGLVTTNASYEYPVWVLLDDGAGGPPTLRHVKVRNPSRRLAGRLGPFAPCAVLRLFGGIRRDRLFWPRDGGADPPGLPAPWLARAGRGAAESPSQRRPAQRQ